MDTLLESLAQQAAKLDQDNRANNRALAEQWFSAEVFSCRSSLASDYVAETSHLWQQRQQAKNPQVLDFIDQQISQQLLALTTALRTASLPLRARDQRLEQQSSVAAMHKQLAQYRDYERRLQQQVDHCRQRQDTIAAQQQEKRLNRCQQAILQLERKIQRHEEG